jgi:hypothetical protein
MLEDALTHSPPNTTDLKSMLRNPFGMALVAYYLLMAIVGMVVPDDILQSHAWAREFSDFMAGIVPQIVRVTALNIKPDVNRFYFSLLWAGSPVLFAICCLLIWYGRKLDYPMWRFSFPKALLHMSVIFLSVLWTQYLWAVDTSMGLSRMLFGNYFGRSFFAQIVFHTGATFFIAGLAVWGLGWLTGYIPGNIKRTRNA